MHRAILTNYTHTPPGGYCATVLDKEWRAYSSFHELVDEVEAYMRANDEPGIPALIVEQATISNILTKHPSAAREWVVEIEVDPHLDIKRVFRGGRAVVEHLFGKKSRPPVTPEEATARGDVCRGCPMRVEPEEYADEEGMLEKFLRARAKMLTEGRGGPELGVCGLCGCELSTLVHISPSHFRENPEDRLPAHCWKDGRTLTSTEPTNP